MHGGKLCPYLTDLLCSSQVFPHGLPEEFTLIFTLALKKAALKDTVYLFQISDQQGYPQVPLTFCFLIVWFLHIFHDAFSPFLDLPPFVHPLPIHPTGISSLFCIVIHFPLRFLLSGDIFSFLSPYSFLAPFVLSYSSSHPPLSLCHSSTDHLLLSSPLSFTLIVIHVCSMMKNWSLLVSPLSLRV